MHLEENRFEYNVNRYNLVIALIHEIPYYFHSQALVNTCNYLLDSANQEELNNFLTYSKFYTFLLKSIGMQGNCSDSISINTNFEDLGKLERLIGKVPPSFIEEIRISSFLSLCPEDLMSLSNLSDQIKEDDYYGPQDELNENGFYEYDPPEKYKDLNF
ncbi:MAG: hypothetical protein KC589_05705 [Nanoarchaeota archaeon]|nr:hypothetical protein [Nanoarchaeota archaeon]